MRFDIKEDGKRILMVCVASLIMALNIKTFVKTGGLFPGGATGLTILIQRSARMFFHIEVPYTLVNVILNAIRWSIRSVLIPTAVMDVDLLCCIRFIIGISVRQAQRNLPGLRKMYGKFREMDVPMKRWLKLA